MQDLTPLRTLSICLRVKLPLIINQSLSSLGRNVVGMAVAIFPLLTMRRIGRYCSQSIAGAVMPIKLTSSFANLILFVLLTLSVSSCGSSGFVEFELRGHVYKVPSRYVVMKPPSLSWVDLRKGSDNTTRGVLLSMPVEEMKKRVPGFIAYPWANDLSLIVNEEKSFPKYVESLIDDRDVEKVVPLDGTKGIYKYVTSYGPWYITKEMNLRRDYDSLLAACKDKDRNEFNVNECTFWFESGSAFIEYDADLANAANHREIERAISDWLSSWEVRKSKAP